MSNMHQDLQVSGSFCPGSVHVIPNSYLVILYSTLRLASLQLAGDQLTGPLLLFFNSILVRIVIVKVRYHCRSLDPDPQFQVQTIFKGSVLLG